MGQWLSTYANAGEDDKTNRGRTGGVNMEEEWIPIITKNHPCAREETNRIREGKGTKSKPNRKKETEMVAT